jgi:hypothetical protein
MPFSLLHQELVRVRGLVKSSLEEILMSIMAAARQLSSLEVGDEAKDEGLLDHLEEECDRAGG